MCLTVFLVIVLVVALMQLQSIDASTKLTSAEVCQQIRSQKVSILTMGSRGPRVPHQHRFYLLTSLGYLFVVPFANLKVDLQAKRAKLTIDTDYKDASQLYHETSGTFTTKAGKGAKQLFYLVTIHNQPCLMREYGNSSHTCYYSYHLDEGGKYRYYEWPCIELDGSGEEFAMNIDSNEHRIEQSVLFYKIKFLHGWYPTSTIEHNFGGMNTHSDHYVKPLVKFPLKRPILTSFYVGVYGHNYTVLLSDSGRVIVGENAFEVSLSDFIECSFPSNNSTFPWIVVIASVVVITLGGCALYLVIKKRKDKANRKAEAREASPCTNLSIPNKKKKKKLRKERKLTNASMQARTLITSEIDSPSHSSITPSKIYTSINMITSKIGSLFQSNAKSVAKANNSKDKTKASKSKLDKAKVTKKKNEDDDQTKK